MSTNKTVLFINTGSGKNLGDRAMLLNLALQCKNHSVQTVYVSDDFPAALSNELSAVKYPLLYHCFGRFKAAERGSIAKAFTTTVVTAFAFVILLLRVFRKRALPWKFMEAEMANALASSDLVVFCGGGYLTDKGMLECRASLLTGLFAVVIGKPVVMSGQGIGPLGSSLSRFLLRKVANASKATMVRDPEASKKLLLQVGVNEEKIMPIGDDAFTLPAKNWNEVTSLEEQKILAVHFRISNFTANAEAITESLLSALKVKELQGWKIRFFIFSEMANHELDIINSKFSRTLTNIEIIQSRDPRELKYKISECDLAIGIAYHFLVFALTTGVPTIGMFNGAYYKQKVCGLFSWFNMAQHTLPFAGVNHADLLERFEDLSSRHEEISDELRQLTIINAAKCEQFYSQYIFPAE